MNHTICRRCSEPATEPFCSVTCRERHLASLRQMATSKAKRLMQESNERAKDAARRGRAGSGFLHFN